MKKMNSLLRRCKTLSRQLGRSPSMRSKSTRDYYQQLSGQDNPEPSCETVFVGSTRRRYVISSKYLTHPLLNALIHRETGPDLAVRCEVVLFDHLLWMLENADPNLTSESSLEELKELYAY